MNRRSFLKLAGLGSVAAGLGTVASRVAVWWDQAAGADYQELSLTEAKITGAIVDAMFPGDRFDGGIPNALDTHVIEKFDHYLYRVDARSSNLLRVLLHTIDEMSIFSDFGLTRFHKRPREERIAILKAWDNSSITVRRKAFRGLKLLLAGGYCTDQKVLGAAGIHFTCGGPA